MFGKPLGVSRTFSRRGFTMMEILIVGSVISFLLGVTGTTMSHQVKKSFDAKRKEDLRKLSKAFEEYYNDNQCYPTSEQWQSATCATVPPFLAPYTSAFPCDPELKTPYVYQTTDQEGNPCEGTCGECVGYRLLAALSNTQDPDIISVGCDPYGCGVPNPGSKNPNWGIAMGSSVPVPGFIPSSILTEKTKDESGIACKSEGAECEINSSDKYCCSGLTCVPNNPNSLNGKCLVLSATLTPTHTVAPSSTPTSLPSPSPDFEFDCKNNLIANGSFELDMNNDRFPDMWNTRSSNLQYYLEKMQEGEGVDCSGNHASTGKCGYVGLGWLNTGTVSTLPMAYQTIPLSYPDGTYLSVSYDAKVTNISGSEGIPYANVSLLGNTLLTNGSSKERRHEISGIDGTWTTITQTYPIPANAKGFQIGAYSYGPDTLMHSVDNVCINTAPAINLNTPLNSYCPGQLLVNGSFEKPSMDDSRLPEGWIAELYGKTLDSGEGINCEQATSGSCAFLYFPSITSESYSHSWQLTQSVPVSGKPGDVVNLSFDALLKNFTKDSAGSFTVTIGLSMKDTIIVSPGRRIIYLSKMSFNNWERTHVRIVSPVSYSYIVIKIAQSFYDTMLFDSFCLTKN